MLETVPDKVLDRIRDDVPVGRHVWAVSGGQDR
jgi:hypothetical protein